MRRSDVHPVGGVIVTELGVNPIAAIMTSLSRRPVGAAMLISVPAGLSAIRCATPVAELVLASERYPTPPPEIPAVACVKRVPSSDCPEALGAATLAVSYVSSIGPGGPTGAQVLEAE